MCGVGRVVIQLPASAASPRRAARAQAGRLPLKVGIEILAGRIVSELRSTIQQYFDSEVRAVLERTVTTEGDRQERISYRLVGLQPEDTLGLLHPVQIKEAPRSLPEPR